MNTFQNVSDWPVTGHFLSDFELTSSIGQSIRPSDYLNRQNLVLVFAGDYGLTTSYPLLADLARHYDDITQENAEVLAVVRGTTAQAAQTKQNCGLPYAVLADDDGRVHRAYAALSLDGRTASEAVYVAGRFSKVYLASRATDTPSLPTLHDIMGTLRFIEGQCPECGREEL